MDISTFVQQFLTLCINTFGYVYHTLNAITFYGFSLLDFIISINVVVVLVVVIINVNKHSMSSTVRHTRSMLGRNSHKGNGD